MSGSAENEIAAAGPACDQVQHGDRYWFEFHEADLSPADGFETAYVTIASPDLQAKLLQLGIDENVDGVELAIEVLNRVAPDYSSARAA